MDLIQPLQRFGEGSPRIRDYATCRRVLFKVLLISSMTREAKAHFIGGLFDIGTIFWGASFAAFFHYTPSIVKKQWTQLSPGQQYLFASFSFMGALLSPVFVGCYLLNSYVSSDAWILIFPITMLLFPRKTEESKDNFIQRFQYKHFTVRLLWRDQRTRTCNNCGRFDRSTRDVNSAPKAFQSIHDPCPWCGSMDFRFHYLDYSPKRG